MILKPFSSFVPTKGFLNQLQFPVFFCPFTLRSSLTPRTTPSAETNLLAPVEFGHLFHAQLGQVVVFIGKVTRGPHQASRRRFRLGLFPEFDFPTDALLVYNFELWGGALLVFFDERELPGRLVLFAAGPIEEIERLNVTPVAPQGRGRSRGAYRHAESLGLGCLVREDGKG